MIIKDIAEYEDSDSELAKFTISQLHCKIQELETNKDIEAIYQCDEEGFEWIDKKTYDALYEEYAKLKEIIFRAIEYIEKCKEDSWNIDLNDLLEILKGEDTKDVK